MQYPFNEISFYHREPGEGRHASLPHLLSRKHAVLLYERDCLTVTDLGSLNGTWIETATGKWLRAPANVPVNVDPGSTLYLGGKQAVLDVNEHQFPNPFV
eukprot:gene10974-11129_t